MNAWLERLKEKSSRRTHVIKLNLDLDYSVRKVDRDGDSYWKENRQITDAMIRNAISAHPEKKPDRTTKRALAKVMDKLTEAVNDEDDVIEIDGTELHAIKDALVAFDTCPGQYYPWVEKLLTHVEKLVEEEAEREREERLAKKAEKAEKKDKAAK